MKTIKDKKERLSVAALFITVICFNDGPNLIKYPFLALGVILLIWSLYDYYKVEKADREDTITN